jgi:hypothetical protein
MGRHEAAPKLAALLLRYFYYVLVPGNQPEEETYSNDMFSIYPFVHKNYKHFIRQIRISWQESTICKYLEQA